MPSWCTSERLGETVMIVAQQNDLFGFAEVVAKPMRLSWKKCACADCNLGECYCEFMLHEIILTENSGVFEVLVIDFSKNDGFREIVTEKFL
jgi:hypothetical protein